ncbi:MAG: PLP-dependent aminotransferase family protein [Propionibacteriaceae bacterium]|nr:PLP-dependent aminotransferase family protein [Propionibacteriaceae bacterium]
MRTAPAVTLPLELSGEGPLPVQITAELRRLIGDTVLAPGESLPSTRALAAYLGISRGTVVAAYDQLLAEGYLSASIGRSTVVNPQLQATPVRPPRMAAPEPAEARPALDLRPGRPATTDVVNPAWKAAWRQASLGPADATIPPLGLPELREAWADHLRRTRAVVRDPGQLAVTGGGREGLALLLLSLSAGETRTDHLGHQEPSPWSRVRGGRSGPLRVGVEEPGYPSLRKVPARLGAAVLPVGVDAHGLRVADLPTGADAPDLLVVTPSHQYPLGGSLPVDRRQALLEWARRHQVVVVEDDYDSELRYTSQPLPALAALDDPADGRVVLLGTLSQTLTPALGIGYLALPAWLVPLVTAARRDLGGPVGLVTQRAMAQYLAGGALRLHTQRMRTRYRRRRAQVVAALAEVPGLRVSPMDGGLHAVVESSRPEAEVVARLAASGVRVSPLSRYWSATDRTGIVFGFGAVTETELAHALRLIAQAMRQD